MIQERGIQHRRKGRGIEAPGQAGAGRQDPCTCQEKLGHAAGKTACKSPMLIFGNATLPL